MELFLGTVAAKYEHWRTGDHHDGGSSSHAARGSCQVEPPIEEVLVSVVTPTYQGPERLAEAIQSVINQRHQNWEMIVVDDGSHSD